MPELPEVETIRIGLSALLPGREVAGVTSNWAKSFPNSQADVDKFLIGAKIVQVTRRAKVLLIELGSKYSLVIHLKMTGQLVFVGQQSPSSPARSGIQSEDSSALPTIFPLDSRLRGNDGKGESVAEVRFGAGHPNESLVGILPDKSTRVTFTFTDGSRLFFNDQRKFGWIRLIPTAEVPHIDFFKKLGPEPLSMDFTWKVLKERLGRRANSNIKAAILDQTVVAGIGNIYADESFWGAKIHPATLVKNISDAKIRKLYEAVTAVLLRSIEKGGSTDKNYVDAEGRKGSYLKFANVFRRDGQPCPRHPDTMILKIRVAGRGTHICPRCQKVATR